MVGAEPVGAVRGTQPRADVAAQGIEGSDKVGEDRDEDDRQDKRAADEEGTVAQEPRERLCRRAARRARRQRLSAACSLQPHPRIDDRVEQIHDQVHRQVDHRQEQKPALDDGEVARENGADHEAADAGKRKDLLDDDGPAEQRAGDDAR